MLAVNLDPEAPRHSAEDVDPRELEKFNNRAREWWNPNGPFQALHDINPIRIEFITDRADVAGTRALDIGCGGGIVSESLARLGARVWAVDPAADSLAIARAHAQECGLFDRITFVSRTAESLLEDNVAPFDISVGYEVLEHVPDYRRTVAAMADLTRPGGHVFITGINRTLYSYAMMVLGGEYLLDLLPKGTHDYEKFMKPSELASAARQAGLRTKEVRGFAYNPFTRQCRLTEHPRVNYFLHAQKP